MADLTFKDWGRIYAYMWMKDRVGNSYYKILLETDPVKAITEIIQALNREYPDPALKIEYTPNVDAVWDVEPPQVFTDKELEEYRSGAKLARLIPRFAC